jgi:hypothetical protein
LTISREDVPFLVPRTCSKSEISEVGELEGNAAVLLSAYLPRCTRITKGTKLHEDRSVSDCNCTCLLSGYLLGALT